MAQRAGPILEGLAADMGRHLNDGHRGERVRDGFRIAIIGPPNAGKSSLLNALAQREAAIVSDIPGTTRDVVEVRLVLAGYPVWIADTAGLREAADAIEAEGVRRALARAEEADLRLHLVAVGDWRRDTFSEIWKAGDITVLTKADLLSDPQRLGDWGGLPVSSMQVIAERPHQLGAEIAMHRLSTRTGWGMPELEAAIGQRVIAALGSEEAPVLTRTRHRRLVDEALAALRRAVPALEAGPELAAEDVRAAAHAIGRLTGRIDVEDLLGEIFSSFCIGK